MFKLNIESETDEEHNRIDPLVGKYFIIIRYVFTSIVIV